MGYFIAAIPQYIMSNSSNQDRVRSLYQMLFEMATGNFAFRIMKSEHNDELDELIKIIEHFSGAMYDAIQNAGHVSPHYTYQSLIQTTFVLDGNYQINCLSANVSTILGYKPETLFKTEFSNILYEQTKEYWRHIILETKQDPHYHSTIQLIFVTANKQVLPSFCTVSKLLHSDKIFISSLTTVLQNTLTDRFSIPTEQTPRPSESELIQRVHDYILNNLEEPLPTLKELSKIFSTNEFKIKDGFRHFFNTSVYKFYNEERLKKAHLLIQNTNVSLKTVAYSCGYNDYINFYKAFKKRFGYSPSELTRETGSL